MTVSRCVLCDGAERPRFRVNGHTVVRCDRCDAERVWPTPSPDALAAVYARGYFAGGGHGYDDYAVRERAQMARKAAVRLDALASLGVDRGALLDVGCASGFFLEHAQARGFDVWGVDASAEARASVAPALRDRVTVSVPDSTYDVITLWDVLEHLPAPADTLRELRAKLRPGGVMAVVLPVLGSVNTRWLPRTWDQYKPPEHLWFWSPSAMRQMLSRFGGATVVRENVAWRRDARYVDPEGTSRSPVTRVLRAVDGAVHRAAARAFGDAVVTDSMAFYARAV